MIRAVRSNQAITRMAEIAWSPGPLLDRAEEMKNRIVTG